MITVALPAVLLMMASPLSVKKTVKYSEPSTLVSAMMVIVVQALVSPDWIVTIVMVKE